MSELSDKLKNKAIKTADAKAEDLNANPAGVIVEQLSIATNAPAPIVSTTGSNGEIQITADVEEQHPVVIIAETTKDPERKILYSSSKVTFIFLGDGNKFESDNGDYYEDTMTPEASEILDHYVRVGVAIKHEL